VTGDAEAKGTTGTTVAEAKQDYDDYMAARHRPAHGRRTAERWAGFLLPHLGPGMRLLDLGCGPGSITADLATRGIPATGVDLDPVPVDGVAVAGADGATLPFRDGSFDALYANAVLQHVPDPLAVLVEARRVARPGAVIGVGDADWGGMLHHPADPLIARGYEVHEAMRPGTSVRVGRELRDLLAAAGFVRAEASATAQGEGSTEAVGLIAWFEGSWFAAPEVVAYAEALGASDAGEMAAIADAWTRWAAAPGAFVARFWITALAWAPD
jgi:SAM-dependent methyltransferase